MLPVRRTLRTRRQGRYRLLDPFNIEVIAGSGTTNNGGAPAFTPGGTNSQVGADLITTQLNAGTSVILDTGVPGGDAGNITVNSAIAKTAGTDATLSLLAAGSIDINADITSNTGKLNMVFTGSTVNLGSATLSANGGTINAGPATVTSMGPLRSTPRSVSGH